MTRPSTALEKAVELLPADPTIAEHLGDAYWRVGRTLEAKFQWQHAKDNKPEPDDLKRIEDKLKNGAAGSSAGHPRAEHRAQDQRLTSSKARSARGALHALRPRQGEPGAPRAGAPGGRLS